MPELRKILSGHATVDAYLATTDDSPEAQSLLKAMFTEILGTTHKEITAVLSMNLVQLKEGGGVIVPSDCVHVASIRPTKMCWLI